MATAAAAYALEPNTTRHLELTIPLDEKHHRHWLSFPRRERKEKQPRVLAKRSSAAPNGHGANTWTSELDGIGEAWRSR